MKILAITLARGGSKNIKKKNIKLLNRKPLIWYTIKEAQKSKYIDDYIISTDCKNIKKISEKFNVLVPFLRPRHLSSDKAKSSSALLHALKFMEKKNRIKYDIIVELMCTSPFKTSKDIDRCIKKLITHKADSVIAMRQLFDHHPARIKKIVNGRIKNFCVNEITESRRQDLKPKAYVRAGAIYVLNRDYFIKKKKRYGSKKSYSYILSHKTAINIDEENDFLMAEALIKNEK
jgi:N-acylneuraminate cytidylyltransferase/CMP-N,N'-diacetyllegionaminic acid synthase